ncbi:MAG: HAMP domain-containing protein [Anaerolineales bacterium]|nr:HAMP domain-containing protein [Anaerolineales bacterium]
MCSLTPKLLLTFLIVGWTGVAIVAGLAALVTTSEFGRFGTSRFRSGTAEAIAEHYAHEGSWEGVEDVLPQPQPPPGDPPHGEAPERRFPVVLADSEWRVVLPGPGLAVGSVVPDSLRADALIVQVEGETIGWLISQPFDVGADREAQRFLDRVQWTVAVGAVAAAALALTLGWRLARGLTRPLRDLTAATRAAAEGDLQQRVAVRSQDELGQLADSFNRMSEQLARSMDSRRQMTADVAHDLRTPIRVVIGHLDAVEDGVVPSGEALRIIGEETLRLERLVQDLHLLAMADAGALTLHRTRRPIARCWNRPSSRIFPWLPGRGLHSIWRWRLVCRPWRTTPCASPRSWTTYWRMLSDTPLRRELSTFGPASQASS